MIKWLKTFFSKKEYRLVHHQELIFRYEDGSTYEGKVSLYNIYKNNVFYGREIKASNAKSPLGTPHRLLLEALHWKTTGYFSGIKL